MSAAGIQCDWLTCRNEFAYLKTYSIRQLMLCTIENHLIGDSNNFRIENRHYLGPFGELMRGFEQNST